jgi:hypothetical protein
MVQLPSESPGPAPRSAPSASAGSPGHIEASVVGRFPAGYQGHPIDDNIVFTADLRAGILIRVSAAYLGVGLLADTDADRLRDFVEFCNYNTDPTDPDTDKDQDGLSTGLAKDGCEEASFNEDRLVTAADQFLMAYEMTREISPSLRLVNMDINKDGVVSSGDQLILTSFISPPGQCPLHT